MAYGGNGITDRMIGAQHISTDHLPGLAQRLKRIAINKIGNFAALIDASRFIKRPMDAQIDAALTIFFLGLR